MRSKETLRNGIMTRQYYRKTLRDIDRQLSSYNRKGQSLINERARANSQDIIDTLDKEIKTLAEQAAYLFQWRRRVVEEYANRSTLRPSEQQEDIPVYHQDEQKNETHVD